MLQAYEAFTTGLTSRRFWGKPGFKHRRRD
jgi:hypothetical protein